MTGRCCKASASILPGALALTLPKCPLCLAAWLGAATGIGFTGAMADRLRWAVILISATVLIVAVYEAAQRLAALRHSFLSRGHGRQSVLNR
jgi:hypothetical protein